MSARRSGVLGERLRKYGVALAFVLGQIAPLAITPPREPPAIVRTRADDRDAWGFDPRERLSGRLILTAPLPLISEPAAVHPCSEQPSEPAWLRNN